MKEYNGFRADRRKEVMEKHEVTAGRPQGTEAPLCEGKATVLPDTEGGSAGGGNRTKSCFLVSLGQAEN